MKEKRLLIARRHNGKLSRTSTGVPALLKIQVLLPPRGSHALNMTAATATVELGRKYSPDREIQVKISLHILIITDSELSFILSSCSDFPGWFHGRKKALPVRFSGDFDELQGFKCCFLAVLLNKILICNSVRACRIRKQKLFRFNMSKAD